MAVPKRKTSKARAANRKSVNMRLTIPTLSVCGTCGNIVVPHRVCPKCGFYRGKQVIETEKMA
ncbi:MAG: 50S ribosomal protein L32 [Spirochaetia bacterium]|nr:50S ribosomal protein L32 [Spirochaetia bacterium]